MKMKNNFLINFKIDFSSPLPVYEQVKGRIKQSIAKDELKEDEELISIRQLASILKINPNTVARAYKDLARDGIVEGRSGVGYRILGLKNLDGINILKEKFLKFLEDAADMGIPQRDIRKVILEHFNKEKM